MGNKLFVQQFFAVYYPTEIDWDCIWNNQNRMHVFSKHNKSVAKNVYFIKKFKEI